MESSGRVGMRNPRSGGTKLSVAASTYGRKVTAPHAISAKLDRLASDPERKPRVLDLFAGCGGLSLGFQAAGYDIVGAIEIDAPAARSHAVNFCKGQPEELIERHAKPRDITKIDPEQLVEDFDLGPLE